MITSDQMCKDISMSNNIKTKLMRSEILSTEKLGQQLKSHPDIGKVEYNNNCVKVRSNRVKKNRLNLQVCSMINDSIQTLLKDNSRNLNTVLDRKELEFYNDHPNRSFLNLFYNINPTKTGMIISL